MSRAEMLKLAERVSNTMLSYVLVAVERNATERDVERAARWADIYTAIVARAAMENDDV